MDVYNFLSRPNPDGSLNRPTMPMVAPSLSEPDAADLNPPRAHSKDIPLNPSKRTFIRAFLPGDAPAVAPPKLPVMIYFHGGGFVLASAASKNMHEACERMAAELKVLVLSVEYRLAPEHRLPAAYDDSMEALEWLREQGRSNSSGADAWLSQYADFSRCFLMGSSAGSNIVYHIGLRSVDLDLSPLKIVGLILNQPYFGSVERTASQLRLADDKIVPLILDDLMWSLALPEGADRDHKYCNPMTDPEKEKIARLPPCLFKGDSGDPFVDKQKEVAKMVEACGVKVVARLDEDGSHGAEFFDPVKGGTRLIEIVKEFVFTTCGYDHAEFVAQPSV